MSKCKTCPVKDLCEKAEKAAPKTMEEVLAKSVEEHDITLGELSEQVHANHQLAVNFNNKCKEANGLRESLNKSKTVNSKLVMIRDTLQKQVLALSTELMEAIDQNNRLYNESLPFATRIKKLIKSKNKWKKRAMNIAEHHDALIDELGARDTKIKNMHKEIGRLTNIEKQYTAMTTETEHRIDAWVEEVRNELKEPVRPEESDTSESGAVCEVDYKTQCSNLEKQISLVYQEADTNRMLLTKHHWAQFVMGAAAGAMLTMAVVLGVQ